MDFDKFVSLTTIKRYIQERASKKLKGHKALRRILESDKSVRKIGKKMKYYHFDDALDCLHKNKKLIFTNVEYVKRSVYIMKIYNTNGSFTGLCKIGYSSNAYNRAKQLNEAYKKYGFIFKVYKLTEPVTNFLSIEKSIHFILKRKNLDIHYNEDGGSEIFKYKEWYDEMI